MTNNRTATEVVAERSQQRVLDLGIVESEIREIQAKGYCGDIQFSFDHGVLKPISRGNGTKYIEVGYNETKKIK